MAVRFSSFNALCASIRRNHIPLPGCAAATGASPSEYPPRSWLPTPYIVAPPCRPPWTLPPSPTVHNLWASYASSIPHRLAVHQGTCRGQWGASTSAPCRPPRVCVHFPSSPKTSRQFSLALHVRPQTRETSVGGLLSLTIITKVNHSQKKFFFNKHWCDTNNNYYYYY